MEKKWLIGPLQYLACILAIYPANAQAPQHVSSLAVLADRLSFLMTGVPATDDDKNAILNGTLTPAAFAEKNKKHPRFELNLARYWGSLLKLRLPVNLFSVSTHKAYKSSQYTVGQEMGGAETHFYYSPDDNSLNPIENIVLPVNAPNQKSLYPAGRSYGRFLMRSKGGGPQLENPYFIGDTGHEAAPPFCPGFNFDKPDSDDMKCLYEPQDSSCGKYRAQSDFSCDSSAQVNFTPNWDGWQAGKSIKVCPGVARNCSITFPGSDKMRCKPNQKLASGDFDTRLLTDANANKGLCESLLTKMKKYGGFCANTPLTNIALIQPWWAPSQTVPVCKALLEPEVCGPHLERCGIGDTLAAVNHGFTYDSDTFYPQVVEGFSLEPGILIAKIVTEDKSWNDTVTIKESVSNGAMEEMIARAHPKFANRPSVVELNQPAGTYKTANNESVFGAPRSPEDQKFNWSKRSDSASGVLTTMAFLNTFNGNRAKVNGAYEAFLCRKFVLPSGIKPQPDFETDLTKKAVCSECHKVLEPMAQLANKWQHKDNNFAYESEKISTGNFRGQMGNDLSDFGKILTLQPEFSGCAVARTFEFFAGRAMNKKEYSILFPKLLDTFEKNGRKIWSMVPAILESDAFKGVAQ